MRFLALSMLLMALPRFAAAGPIEPLTNDPVAVALQQHAIYVSKYVRAGDLTPLRGLVAMHAGARPLRLALVKNLSRAAAGYGSLDEYTRAVHDFLHLGGGVLVVVTTQGVSAMTDAAPSGALAKIVRYDAPAVKRDPISGIDGLVSDVYRVMPGRAPALVGHNPAYLPTGSARPPSRASSYRWPLIGALVAALALWLARAASRKRRAMRAVKLQRRLSLDAARDAEAWVDRYLDLLPEGDHTRVARALREDAARLLQESQAVAGRAALTSQHAHARDLAGLAGKRLAECRGHVLAATGGTGLAVAIDGRDCKAAPSAGDIAAAHAAPIRGSVDATSVPEADRSACFFCSRPARAVDLTAVNVVHDGIRAQVTACADDVRSIESGSTPAVRTVVFQGKKWPWYAAPGYEPYRDYDDPHALFMPGYGGIDGNGGARWRGLSLEAVASQAYPLGYPVLSTDRPSGSRDAGPAGQHPAPQESRGPVRAEPASARAPAR